MSRLPHKTKPSQPKKDGAEPNQSHEPPERLLRGEDASNEDIQGLSKKKPAIGGVPDLLDNLKLIPDAGLKEKIEIARLELESRRVEIEKERTLADQKFWIRNFGTTITAIISLTAVLVSVSQIWTASIQKEKELVIVQAQKEKEIETAKTQKQKELEMIILQQDRAWKLDMAKFISEHGDKLLGKDKAQRELITSIMVITFPPEYSNRLIDRLEAVTNSPEVKQELQNIRAKVLPRIRDQVQAANKGSILRDSEILIPPNIIDALQDMGSRGDKLGLKYSDPTPNTVPTNNPSPKAVPHDSCSCPPPFEGGISCGGWDDVALCEVKDNKCLPRCDTGRR